jgi:hypothetical protein
MQLHGSISALRVASHKNRALQNAQYHEFISFFPLPLDNGPPHGPKLLIAPLCGPAPSCNVTQHSSGVAKRDAVNEKGEDNANKEDKQGGGGLRQQ